MFSIDHHKDSKVISLTEQQITVQSRPTHETTVGWKICCQWKDSSTSCEKLSNLKNPIQCRQMCLLLCRGLIMSLLFTGGLSMCSRKETEFSVRNWKTRYLKKNHKFDIELPTTVEQALALDAKNGKI